MSKIVVIGINLYERFIQMENVPFLVFISQSFPESLAYVPISLAWVNSRPHVSSIALIALTLVHLFFFRPQAPNRFRSSHPADGAIPGIIVPSGFETLLAKVVHGDIIRIYRLNDNCHRSFSIVIAHYELVPC